MVHPERWVNLEISVVMSTFRDLIKIVAVAPLLLVLTSVISGAEEAALMTATADRPTFTRDIQSILQVKCQGCHRPGQIAPMSLLTYEETRPWASAIRKEVSSKRMPPFHATGPIGHWKDDLRLPETAIETIVRWVDQGAVRGNPADLPAPRDWPESEWPYGEPDFVVDFPVHRIPSTSRDVNINLYSDYAFPEDTWLNTVHFTSRYQDTVHHAHIYMIPPDYEIPEKNKSRERTAEVMVFQSIFTWFPGLTVEPLPDGQGIHVPKGSRFALVAHFAPRTDVLKEKLRLGVYRSNGMINRERLGAGGLIRDIQLPPHEANYTLRRRDVFPEDGWITHFWAHMHYRGKSVEFRLHYADGRSETVFDMPQYSFDWQRYYYLSEPLRVLEGTELETIATWDNSDANALNPDPTQAVRWGSRTTDEMFGGGVRYTPIAEMAEPFVVKDGVRVAKGSAESSVK